MKTNQNRSVGEIGENAACEHLIRNGWKILARNYHRKSDEIDIIAKSTDGTLVFCEVKALVGNNQSQFGGFMPEDNLSAVKLRKISRVCQFFARRYPELIDPDRGWQIDLLAIDIDNNGKARDIRHYENI